MTGMTLVEQLYIALRSSPCHCCGPMRRRPTPENPKVLAGTTKCSHCAALERYEKEMGIQRWAG